MWRPGRIDAERRIVRDLSAQTEDVRFVLPKVVLEYVQGDDLSTPPSFRLKAWGDVGFGSTSDLAAGEVVRMEPPIAAHSDGRVGFGVGEALVDLSPDSTPPDILARYGTDEGFQGVFVSSARLYYADKDKDLAIHAAVDDLLVSLSGQVSFGASVDLIGPESTLEVRVRIYDGGREVTVTPGKKVPPSTAFTGGRATATSAAVAQLEIEGGVPPLTVDLMVDGGANRWDAAARQATLAGVTAGEHDLLLTVLDSAPTAERQSHVETIKLVVTPAAGATAPGGAPADRLPAVGDLPAISSPRCPALRPGTRLCTPVPRAARSSASAWSALAIPRSLRAVRSCPAESATSSSTCGEQHALHRRRRPDPRGAAPLPPAVLV